MKTVQLLLNTFELEKNRNWHWMWSSFIIKKYKGFSCIIIIFPKLLSAIFKTLFYLLIFNSEKRDIYFCRISGIFNSVIGKNSWYRPALD